MPLLLASLPLLLPCWQAVAPAAAAVAAAAAAAAAAARLCCTIYTDQSVRRIVRPSSPPWSGSDRGRSGGHPDSRRGDGLSELFLLFGEPINVDRTTFLIFAWQTNLISSWLDRARLLQPTRPVFLSAAANVICLAPTAAAAFACPQTTTAAAFT